MRMNLMKMIVFAAPAAIALAQTPAAPHAPAEKAPVSAPKLVLEDPPGADPVVLTVGDEKMTRSEFERLLSVLPDQAKQQAAAPGGKKRIADQLVELKAMSQEARKRGLDKTPETKQMITMQTDNVLAGSLYKEIAGGVKTDDAAARAYYDQHKSEYEEVTARHILIRFKGSPVPLKAGEKDLTEEEALAHIQELRKRILAGEDFAKVASAENDDESAGKNGGSLGPFGHGRMVAQFEQAAFKQPVGEIGEPVKTQFGYHIIQVEKHDTQPFDAVKPQIEQKLKPEMAKKAVDEIRKQTSVTMNEAYFAR